MTEEKMNVPVSVDDFIALELLRLVSTINRVPPESREYAQLMENVERFGALATLLPDIWQIFSKYYAGKSAPVDSTEPEIVEFKPKVDIPVATEEAQVSEATEPDSPIPEDEPMFDEEPQEEAPAYDAPTVKKALSKARSEDKVPKIAEWLKENFDVEGFSAIPASRYGELMDKLKALGVSV